MMAQVDAPRRGQPTASREVVVEKESGANQPRGPQVRIVRQHEEQRPDDMRRGREQHFAFLQRLAHQVEVEVLEIAQTAMHQLRAGG